MLSFVLFHAVIFVGGTWLAIGLRTGIWDPAYLLCDSAVAVALFDLLRRSRCCWPCGRGNAVVCVFGSIAVLVRGLEHELRPARPGHVDRHVGRERCDPRYLSGLVDFGYWVLPKPADLGMLLLQRLGRRRLISATCSTCRPSKRTASR